ncbi:MAG: SUMF1/EgtB/PvdO family nonheme iron enzyme [Bacteroidales bacterium]|nr:SUMF1/EgtB/PvdO family nonheme iron enzyme [Bacteroidales bacterium]
MSKGKAIVIAALCGFGLGAAFLAGFHVTYAKTSSNEYCMSCHIHTDADASWKQSVHVVNSSGTVTDCVDCHLPSETEPVRHFAVKTKMGAKDIFSKIFKDTDKIDWDAKGELEHAQKIVFNESCVNCHANLYPEGVTDEAVVAHLYYEEYEKKYNLQCISCHLDAGHYDPNYKHESMKTAPVAAGPVYEARAEVTAFADYTETVPGTTAAIKMIAVPGGSFTIGSPEGEAFRKADEGPQRRVEVSPFFMAEVETTWDQFWAFYNETMSEGRTPPAVIYANNSRDDIDAVSGPTPPFGAPDQGWGMGSRPAITMTHYAAETFCQWLSLKTGRKYRLPTEAEWEYAARGGTTDPYWFEGNPRKFSQEGFLRSVFKADTAGIARNAVYAANSGNRTQEPGRVAANPFGLKNMLGNVMEYCSDWYAEDAYKTLQDGAVDPKGPQSGSEYVVRGGSYASDAADLRCAARGSTRHDDWLRTDPQNPKSIWWYSDIKGIGFRVVCEVPDELK